MMPPATRASVMMLRIAVAVVLIILQCCSVILAARPLPSEPGEGNGMDWQDPGYSGVGEFGFQP